VKRAFAILALAVLAAALASGPAAAAPVAGAQVRLWSFSDDETMRDVLAYVSPGPFHVQLEYWDFERGEDQFRPEVGLHLRDRRRSSYDVQWRHEKGADRFGFGTGQILGRHWVARAAVSPIVTSDEVLTVAEVGADVYWKSWSFAGVTLIRDPREAGLWVVPVRARFASEANDWFQLTLAPASRKTIGWAADAKLRLVRLGVERNSRFDFTARDNVIVTAGLEVPLPGPR
jgi:hypothetical protein